MNLRLLMHTCALSAPTFEHPTICHVDGDDGDGDGDKGGAPPPPPKKTFTQEEVARIAAKEKSDAARVAREKADAEWKEKHEALQAEVAELKKASMTADERAAAERKEREAADKRARDEHDAKRKEQLDKANKRAESAEERWKGDRRNGALSTALHAAKVIGDAAPDAAAVMLSQSKVDVDDDGNITGVIYGGKSYDTLAEAAKQFLADKPHFAQPTALGGTGSRGGSGGPRGKGAPLFNASREDLLAATIAGDRAAGRK